MDKSNTKKIKQNSWHEEAKSLKKIVKEWEHKGYRTEISAQFIKNGREYWDESWNSRVSDVVLLEGIITPLKEGSKLTLSDRAYSHTRVLKYYWIRKNITQDVTIVQDYSEKLEKMNDMARRIVEEQIYSKEITEGIPDSLEDL